MLEVWIITIVESLLILAYCIYLLHIYAAKDRTPLYVKILTVIGWLSGYLIILLIPLDIYIVSKEFIIGSSTKPMEKWILFLLLSGTSCTGPVSFLIG